MSKKIILTCDTESLVFPQRADTARANIFGVHDENKNESIVFFRFLAAYCLESYVNQLNPIDEAGHKDKDFMHQVAMRCILTSDCAEVLLNNLSLYFYTDVLRITHTQLT